MVIWNVFVCLSYMIDYCNKREKIKKNCKCYLFVFFLWLMFDVKVKISWEKNIISFKGENYYYIFLLSNF